MSSPSPRPPSRFCRATSSSRAPPPASARSARVTPSRSRSPGSGRSAIPPAMAETGSEPAVDIAPTDDELARVQRRTVWVLSGGQVLGGLAFGATLSLGAVLAAELSGEDAFSGLAAAAVTFGTALTAVPLAAIARRHGRRASLPP